MIPRVTAEFSKNLKKKVQKFNPQRQVDRMDPKNSKFPTIQGPLGGSSNAACSSTTNQNPSVLNKLMVALVLMIQRLYH